MEPDLVTLPQQCFDARGRFAP